jgi:DNA-binding transcriptional MocR family regulator
MTPISVPPSSIHPSVGTLRRVEATISFARGVPAPECLPVEELAECARAALARDGRTVLSYGSSGGYAPLREWIAARHGADPARVLLTNGSLQGFLFLARRLAPGRRVLVERPTYDRPLKILAALGAEVVAVPMDDEGLDPDALEAALADGEPPAFLYTIPTFQNPSGRTLTLERRRRIVELADEHGLLVLEDDPYGLVRFEGEAPPSLHELSDGRVAYSSSFSKTIAPGLRVGYFVLPAELERELEATAVGTYITPALLGQATVHEFVDRGLFEPNLERVRGLLKARRDAMLEALDRVAPGGTWSRPEGGYFVWLTLAGPVDADEAGGVTFVRGVDFGGGANEVRLAYSFAAVDEVALGIERLAAALPVAV